MTIRGALRLGVLVCVLSALGAFGVAEAQPVLVAVFMLASCAGWWVTEWRPSRAEVPWRGLPRWLTNLLLVVIVGFSVFAAFSSRSLVTTFATLLASVLVIKLWQERRATDYGQLLTMSLFLTIASVLSDNSALTGVLVLVQTPAMAASAMLYQVWHAGERASGGERSGAIEREAWKRFRGPFAVVCVVALLAGAAVAVPVFVVMPRGYLLPQFRSWSKPSVGRTVGFTDQIDLSAGAPQEGSTVVVMEVQLRPAGGEGLPVLGSSTTPVYLRGAVLDAYEETGRWRAAPAPVRQEKIRPTAGSGHIDQPQRSEGGFAITITSVRPRVSVPSPAQVFSVGRGYKWEFSEVTDISLNERTGAATYTNKGLSGYSVSSMDSRVPQEGVSRSGATFPEERVRTYAERLLRAQGIEPDPTLRDPSEDAAAARVFETHLRENFSYSLENGAAPIQQPVAWFLETERKGHCEFFASALAGLCRSVGIDANVIAGYLGTEFDPVGGVDGMGAYVVRASDAHAWVEVNTAPGVWRTFDATPEATPGFRVRERGALSTVLDRLVWAIEDVWNSRVVSYDRSTQERLLNVQGRPGGFAGVITSVFDRSSSDQAGEAAKWVVRAVPLVSLAAVAVGVGVWLWRRSRAATPKPRFLLPGWAAAAHPEAQRLYQQVAVTLAHHGVQRMPGATLREVLRTAALPATTARELEHAAALLYDTCFAGKSDVAAMVAVRRRLKGRA